MKIFLKDFGSKKRLEISFKARFEDFEFRGDKVEFFKEVEVSGIISKLKGKFVLDADISTELELTCSRCLDRFVFRVDVPLHVVYIGAQSGKEVKGRELKEEDIAISYYSGEEIDIDEDVMGAVVLSIPMKPLCREDCKGLCPICGANLNREQCNCRVEYVDPRLEKLKVC